MNQINLVRVAFSSLVEWSFHSSSTISAASKDSGPSFVSPFHYILGTNPLWFSLFSSSFWVYPSLLHQIGALTRMNKLRGMEAAEWIHQKKTNKQTNKTKTTTDFNPSLNQGFPFAWILHFNSSCTLHFKERSIFTGWYY